MDGQKMDGWMDRRTDGGRMGALSRGEVDGWGRNECSKDEGWKVERWMGWDLGGGGRGTEVWKSGRKTEAEWVGGG